MHACLCVAGSGRCSWRWPVLHGTLGRSYAQGLGGLCWHSAVIAEGARASLGVLYVLQVVGACCWDSVVVRGGAGPTYKAPIG